MSLNSVKLIAALVLGWVLNPGYVSAAPSLDQAKRIINSIDYLPFSATRDGCYARAYYMGMELVSKGIPVSSQYVFGELSPTSGIRWQYHVAPLVEVEVGGNRRFAVFDPSVYNMPMTKRYWVMRTGPKGPAETYIAPISHYANNDIQDRAKKRAHGYVKPARSIREIPKFDIRDVARSCKTAWEFIEEEQLDARMKKWKQKKLFYQTNLLVARLKKMGKLEKGSRIHDCSKAQYVH